MSGAKSVRRVSVRLRPCTQRNGNFGIARIANTFSHERIISTCEINVGAAATSGKIGDRKHPKSITPKRPCNRFCRTGNLARVTSARRSSRFTRCRRVRTTTTSQRNRHGQASRSSRTRCGSTRKWWFSMGVPTIRTSRRRRPCTRPALSEPLTPVLSESTITPGRETQHEPR